MMKSEHTKENNSHSEMLGESKDMAGTVDNIYIDLDTMLDTRLGTLAKMGDDKAVAVLNSGKYHNRMVDNFEGIPLQEFKDAYAKRDIDTLKSSVLTNMVFFLRRMIKDSLLSAIINQKVEKICFTVNVYPYDFSDPELVDMLIGCIRFHTYSSASVQIISIPDEELTPEHCKTNYQIMIRYDWLSWLEKHKKYFEVKGIPEVSIVAPEMFKDVMPTEEEIERLELKKQNPFKITEQMVAPMFRLKLMPSSLFSIHESITKDTAKEALERVEITEADIAAYLDKNHPGATLVRDNPLPKVDLNSILSKEDELL